MKHKDKYKALALACRKFTEDTWEFRIDFTKREIKTDKEIEFMGHVQDIVRVSFEFDKDGDPYGNHIDWSNVRSKRDNWKEFPKHGGKNVQE